MALNDLPEVVVNELKDVSQIAEYLWNKEWAERNAGNISIDFSAYFEAGKIPEGCRFISCPLPAEVASLTLFVTGMGCYLRSLINKIEEAACIIQVNVDASGYYIIWGGKAENFRATSELITHVKIHHYNKLHRPAHKAILHTHPLELIVLSHHELFQDEEKFNHSLWKMCPEIKVFVPQGICCASYALSSSEALADITIHGLKKRNVILWEKHGALATGENINKAFDYLDVANKGAKMLLMAWAAGFEPRGLSLEEMKDLEDLTY